MNFFKEPQETIHITSQNQLHKYLPEINLPYQINQQILSPKFSTVEQINKSIQIEKNLFDQNVNEIYQKISQSTNLIINHVKDCSKLKEKIQNLSFTDEFDNYINGQIQEPVFPLNSINYTSNTKQKIYPETKQQQKSLFCSEIQKFEKSVANLYWGQTQKLNSFEEQLSQQLEKITNKISQSSTNHKEQNTLQLKILKNHDNLINKIKLWEKQLHNQFEEKLCKLITKIQCKL